MRVPFCIAAMLLAGSACATDVCRATSGATLKPLVELYTSEGCDSCPPADRWLSEQFPASREHVGVPLAFHVDYWDRLGWKDRFASPSHTARQQQAMRANGATFVYTPQVVVQGRDHAWRRGSLADALAKLSARDARATLSASATAGERALDVDVVVSLKATPKPSTVLAVAYVDSALASDVTAGENRGERLRHDHVVRAFDSRALTAKDARFRLRLERPAEAGAEPKLVAFVQNLASGEVLQTLSMPLEGCP